MKVLFCIADGMGDWPLESLGGATPLGAARTPNLDAMARTGLAGLARTVPDDMPPGSDVANMALLGFDPHRYHTGRGPIEAAAQGLSLPPEALIWRLNTVTVSEFSDSGLMRDYSAGHIATADSTALLADLAAHCDLGPFELHPGVQYRHLLVQRSAREDEGPQCAVRPPHDITDQGIAPDIAEMARFPALARFAADAAARLAANPANATNANAVWPWGQGRPLSLPSFRETFGLTGGVISAVDLVKGLGRAAGLTVAEVPGVTGLVDTNYEGKVAAALDILAREDFVFVHLEGPDEAGHGGNAADKVEAIRRFDERVLGPLRAAMQGQDAVFLVACDHLTPIAIRTHHRDPVPFLLFREDRALGPGLPEFTEATAATTGIRLDRGQDLLPFVLERARS